MVFVWQWYRVCPHFLFSNLVRCAASQANLHALIQLKPALSHLGDKGLLLLLRWVFTAGLSVNNTFQSCM